MTEIYNKLLEISEDDLKSAEVLYKEKLYPQAVFFLQQSVEKASKAWGVISEAIPKSDKKIRKKVGHDSAKVILLKASKQKEMYDLAKKMSEYLNSGTKEEYDETLSYLEKKINKIKKYREEGINLSTDDNLKQIIEGTEKKVMELSKYNITISLTDEKAEVIIKNLKESFKLMEKKLGLSENQSISFINLNKEGLINLIRHDFFENKITNLIEYIISFLSIIIDPHESKSRYPDNNFSSKELYTSKIPLIQEFPHLIIMQKLLIEFIKDYLKHIH